MDAREALQWFVNTFGLYIGSTRGLFITDWAEEREANLEAAIINLKSRGFNPCAVTGETVYKQADYLWKESRAHTTFGRPLASKMELELNGSDVVILDNLEAPENSRHLWYLWSHILYPRTVAGKATIITTPLSYAEFVRYGEECNDPDFCGKSVNWEKLLWLIEASMITIDVLKQAREESLPPMLKAEYELYCALKERGLDVIPQHVLGDFMLDFALIDRDKRVNIECDTVSSIGGVELQRQEAKRNLVLFSDGWQVLKLTTWEILGNKAGCVDVVDDIWRTGRKRGSCGRLLTGNMVPPVPDLPVDDDVQMAAITYGGGPSAICGGAGTGKTTCLVQRVVYLIGQGVNPENVLVITHGTDAQRALKRSFETLLEKQAAQRLNVCSWQDLGLKILKENLPAIKRKPPLKIEPSPQKIVARLLAKAKKEIDPAKLELSVDLDEFYIAAVISMYKAHLISPKQAKEDAGSYSEEIIARIYQQLEDQLQKANRIDRDDVIAMAVSVLLDNPDLRARYSRHFEFVLVDEYQDATVAQDMLARLLAAPQDNLFVAGDEDETICEAKNACPELFTEISLRMPHTRCYALERNWRSHPAIVDHARQLVLGAQRRRIVREFVSAWGQAPATAIIGPAALADEFDEANWVANEISLLVDSGRNYADIAILFRHHVYASILEEALDNKGVRFQASNPISNFIPDEVEDMLAFLKLVLDPDGPRARESFERVCQLRAKEIDPKLSGTIASFAEANNLSYLKAVEIYSEATADQSCRDLEQLVRMIRTMHQEKLPPAETIALIRRTQRLNDYYRTVKVPAGVNYEPLKKLSALEDESRAFTSTAEFVKHVANQKQGGTNGGADAGVQVLPIMDSKGLEFPVVFMVGMAQGIFPAETAIDVEEERRICYLGLTRAKELLYLSFPQMFSGALLHPSQFLIEARLMTAPVIQHVAEQPVVHQATGPVMPQPAPIGHAASAPPVVPVPQPAQPVVSPAVHQPAQPPMQQPLQHPAQHPMQPAVQPAGPQPVQQPVQQPAPQPVVVPIQPPVAPVRQAPAQPTIPAAVVQPQAPAAPQIAAAAQVPTAPAQPPVQPRIPVSAQQPQVPAQPPITEPVPSPGSEPVLPPSDEAALPRPAANRHQLTAASAAAASIPAAMQAAANAAAQFAAEAQLGAQAKPAAESPAAYTRNAVPAVPEQPGPGNIGAQPADPFGIYTAQPANQRPGMPSLPKPKGKGTTPTTTSPVLPQPITPEVAPAEQPAAPAVAAEPVVPASLEQQLMNAAFAAEPPNTMPYQEQTFTVSQEPVTQEIPPYDQYGQPFIGYDQFGHPVYGAQSYFMHSADAHSGQPHEAAYPQQAYEVSAGHPLCPSCHSPLEANARFCSECGYSLPTRVPACPTCAAPLEATAKFCGECGMALNAPVAGDSSQVSQNIMRMQELKDKQHGWVNKIWKMLEN